MIRHDGNDNTGGDKKDDEDEEQEENGYYIRDFPHPVSWMWRFYSSIDYFDMK